MSAIVDSEENDELDLSDLKEFVRQSEEYWLPNMKYYKDMTYFLSVSTVTDAQAATLAEMGRPPLGFNRLDAVGCRALGEFNAQEPGIVVSGAPGAPSTPQVAATVECMDAHMRYILDHANNGYANQRAFKNSFYGGFGGLECYTDYESRKGVKQCFKYKRLDPLLMGFDPMAEEPHKGDGEYCYKKIYMTKNSVTAKFGKEVAESISYNGTAVAGVDGNIFCWSYESGKRKVAVIVEFYHQKETLKTAVLLSNGEEMWKEDYEQKVEKWKKAKVGIKPPSIEDEAERNFTSIKRYTFCESKIISVEDTIFDMLPLVFVDGNSEFTQMEAGGCLRQYTRSYFHNSVDAQRFKDLAGQTYAGEMQASIQSKIMVAEDSVPPQYLDYYKKPWLNSILPYTPYYNDDPNHPLPPPTMANRPDIPQSIPSAFYNSDTLIDGTLGYNEREIASHPNASGRALQEGSMASDSASQPYFDNFYVALNRVGQIGLNVVPKLYDTPRSIPVTLKNGKKSYFVINDDEYDAQLDPNAPPDVQQKSAIHINYEANDLLITVASGPNSDIQKRNSVDQITRLIGTSPFWDAFFAGPGAETLLDNFEFRGKEKVKSELSPFQEKQQQQQAQQAEIATQMQQMQMQMQALQGMFLQSQVNVNNAQAHKLAADSVLKNKEIDNKEAIDVANLVLEQQKNEAENALKQEENAIKQEKVVGDLLLSRQELNVEQVDQVLRASEIDAERERTAADHALAVSEHVHTVNLDIANLHKPKEKESGETNNKTA